MEKALQSTSRTATHESDTSLARGTGWGALGGLAGTLIMDFILMGALLAMGLPAFTCFSIVGDTVAQFFARSGIDLAGGVPLGVITHYVVGPVFGAIFGAAATKINVLRAGTRKKSVIIAVLYVEILSQPILAMTPILLKMTTSDTIKWFGGSFLMHLVFGVILGVIVSYGLKLGTVTNRG